MSETPMAERSSNGHRVALAAPWGGPRRAVERVSLPREQRDLDEVRSPWQTGHLAAVESLSWEDLIAIGDARLRVGGAVGARPSGELAARRVYFAALYRACREESLEGILRAAEAFADLGDGEVVEECLGLAELKVDGEETHRRASALVQRLEAAQAARSGTAASSAGLDRADGAATY
jgi:hypothetical protein